MADPFAVFQRPQDPFAVFRRAPQLAGKDPTEDDEEEFRRWYAIHAKQWGLDPDPDNPLHRYDYRAAFKAGTAPDPESGHWPSEFKEPDHPNRFVDGVDTITGESISKTEEKQRRAAAWRAARMPAGALPVEQMTAPKDPLEEMSLPELLAGQALAWTKEGVASMLDIPEAAAEVARSGAAPAGKGSVLGRLAPALNPLAPLLGALPEGALKPGGLVGGMRESVREDVERAKEDVQALGQTHPDAMRRLAAVAKIANPALAIALAGQDPAAVGTALTETGIEAAGLGFDPTNAFPAVGALKGAKALGQAERTVAKLVDPDLAELAAKSLDIAPSPAGARVPVQVIDAGGEGAVRRLAAVD